MITYIALLRGVNVGGHRKLPMADLRTLLSKEGFGTIKTYIQSGNVVFRASESDTSVLKTRVEKAISSTFGFEVPVILMTSREFQEILEQNPFDEEIIPESYYILLSHAIPEERSKGLTDDHWEQEHFRITKKCIYLYVENGYGKAKCSTNFFEKKLDITATARNHKTMLKLVSLAAEN